MPVLRRVVLVSDDLMFQSQLGAAVRHGGGELVAVGGHDAAAVPERPDAVFVDLNRDTPHRLGLVAALRERGERGTIVTFCHHAEDETRRMAMQVGASSCVTNGALQAVALRLAGVAAPTGQRG